MRFLTSFLIRWLLTSRFLRPSANSCASLGRYFLRQEFLFISLEMVDTKTLNVFAIKENEELVASFPSPACYSTQHNLSIYQSGQKDRISDRFAARLNHPISISFFLPAAEQLLRLSHQLPISVNFYT